MNEVANVDESNGSPVNILCVDQFSNLGGGQRSLLDLLPAFSERGWHASIALPGDGPFREIAQDLGYPVHNFVFGTYSSKKKPFTQLFKYACELQSLVNSLARLLTETRADLLYVNGPRLAPPAAWVAWRTGTPLVFHCHNRLLQSSAIALTGQALELASAHVIACCHYAADPLREYVEPERMRILYNGVADMGFGRRPATSAIRRIGVVGRVEPEKGQLEFVQAARLVAREVPDCRFSIIGAPMFSGITYYRKVAALSRGLSIDFVDWQDDVAQVYSDLDLLVVPSTALEATTRVILEAYSAGVPVVAFAAGGIPEILEDERTGFLTISNTAEALAHRIVSVLQMDRTRVSAVVARARTEWNRRFTLEQYRADVCSVLARALQPALARHHHAGLHASVDLVVD